MNLVFLFYVSNKILIHQSHSTDQKQNEMEDCRFMFYVNNTSLWFVFADYILNPLPHVGFLHITNKARSIKIWGGLNYYCSSIGCQNCVQRICYLNVHPYG